jgi:hypothetical protein
MNTTIRLIQLAKDENVSIDRIVEVGSILGFNIENKPITKLSAEQAESIKYYLTNKKANPNNPLINAISNKELSPTLSTNTNNEKGTTLSILQDIRKIKGIPKYVYKYLGTNDYHLDCLEKSYLFHSAFTNFNDPFDCYNKLINFRKTPSKTVLSKREQEFNKRLVNAGICCFSRKNTSILMWSHYADKHQGFCLAFSSNAHLRGINPLDVNYTTDFTSLNFHYNGQDAIFNLIYTKSSEWSYEEELRTVLYDFTDANSRKVKFNPTDLKAVYLGAKCSTEFKNKIISILKDKYPSTVELYEAQTSANSFKIEFNILTTI